MKEIKQCEFCGCELTEEAARHFDGVDMCKACFDKETTICNDCDTILWVENAEGNSDISLCENCYERYSHCESCSRLIHNDDTYYDDDSDYPYCHDCFQKLQDESIKSYNYKPEPIFYGSGNLFYGIELEVDEGGESHDNAETLLDISNCSADVLYAKHDSSINDGFELVSHPMTLDYHINNMKWTDIFDEAIYMNYRSHQTSTCGLHIHVNRSAFGKTTEEQEDAISRIVHFVELHWNELLKLSRRTEYNINRWASRYGISATAKDTYKNAKDKRLGRYVAVNLENYSTIEFRLFRGTLRYKTFIATLQLVDEICKLAIGLSDKEIEEMPWNSFAVRISSDKPELIEYLKSKRLYANEITEDTEEI